MLKIEGLDKLQKELEQAEKAFKELDGDLGQVSFDPNDPVSINNAIEARWTCHAFVPLRVLI